jgi:replicative DNA helicase
LNAHAQIVLSELDCELSLMGALFMAPGAFDMIAADIKPEWFSDPFVKHMFEACLALHRTGARLSPPAVIAALPEDCGGMPRKQFYARVCAGAVPANAIGGMIHTLKDRWARRTLSAIGQDMNARAVSFGEDPYEIALDTVLAMDGIHSSRTAAASDGFDHVMQDVVDKADKQDTMRGATTGLRLLDNKVHGYKRGQLYVVAGRPGMGKSAFMCSSLRKTAMAGHGVAIFSLEMTKNEIGSRFVSDAIDNVNGPFFGSIQNGQVIPSYMDDVVTAATSMAGLPIKIEDAPKLTFAEIRAKARRAKSEFEAQGTRLEVVCIDHMGLVTPSDRYKGNKVGEAGEVSGEARALAKELDCCVLLLCQLSRDVEKRDDKRPMLSDLRWSGEIEQDAHVVAFVYREHHYLASDPNAEAWALNDAKNKFEFLIRKNRNGETSDVHLWCSIGHSSIKDTP